MELEPKRIPQALTDRPAWVVWKEAMRDGSLTKMPFQVNGSAAKSNDPATWSTFDAAWVRYELGGYAGTGFMFSADDPFCGIDLDGCRNPETGEVSLWAREIIQRFDSYTEMSPSKTGVKIFIIGSKPECRRNKVRLDQPMVSTKIPGIEVYDSVRYFAVTGWKLQGMPTTIEERPEAMQWLAETYLPIDAPTGEEQTWYAPEAVVERARKYLAKMPGAVSGQRGHDATFRAACVLVLGFGLSQVQALPLLSEWGQTCQPPWSERDLLHKLADAAKKPGARNFLRNIAPERWCEISVPEYSAAAPSGRSDPTTTTLETATRNYLASLADGKSTLIDLGLADVDYAIGGGVEPGEMVILAARPSHGKSAVALQCIHYATAKGLPSVIVSEEMSQLALGKRALQFASDVPSEHWPTSMNEVSKQLDEHFGYRATCQIIESCGTAQRAADAIRRAVETIGAKFVVVDYAQLLSSQGKGRYEQITATSITLRQLANELKIVLIVLCQLNREIEKRNKFIPQSSDLRDSGQLEQDADVVIFMVWPHRIDSKLPPNEFQFYIAKNRNRPINQTFVQCDFKPSRQMFVPERVTPKEWVY